MPSKSKLRLSEKDELILKMNALGVSLATIAFNLNCHPSTITHRLKSLGIPPVDTRRAFMEDILFSMTEEEQEWLSDKIEQSKQPIKEYIAELIHQNYVNEKGKP